MTTNNKDAAPGSKTAFAAIVTGLLASACCVGPLILALLGIGGAGLLAKFEPLRPYFIAFTVLLLGGGFYMAYFRKKKPLAVGATADADACGCEKPKQNRLGKVMLWVASVVAVLAFTSPYLLSAYADNGKAPVVSTDKKSNKRVELRVEGMTCGGCTTNIKLALTRVKGVKNVHMTHQPPKAVVDFDPKQTTITKLIAAVKKAGYKAFPPQRNE